MLDMCDEMVVFRLMKAVGVLGCNDKGKGGRKSYWWLLSVRIIFLLATR